MRTTAALVLGWMLTCSAGCGQDEKLVAGLPDAWLLAATGIELEVRREPYGYAVRDGSGVEVVRTLAEPRGEGYSAFAWTSGETIWSTPFLTKGNFRFETELDAWREQWRVVDAVESDGELTLAFEPRDGARDPGVRASVRHALRASTLRVEVAVEGATPRAFGAAFESSEDEGFLGFGERFTRTDQRGLRVYSWAEEGGIGAGEGKPSGPNNPMPNGEAMTYYPVPFLVSTRGYGFWLDTTWRSTFDLAVDHTDAWRVWEIGPSLSYELYVPTPDDERLWPYQLVDLFTASTGRPKLPPAWAYGPRRRIGRNYEVDGVPEIEAMRNQDLAITAVDDAMHFLPAGSHVGIESELGAWVAAAHALGYKVNGYYNSLLANDPASPLYDLVQTGLANDWFLSFPDGTPSEVLLISGKPVNVLQIDFTSDAATQWFQSMFDWALALDYDGFMYDFGEYVQAGVVASNGMTGEELHNLYPVLYDRAGHDKLESSKKAGDWLLFARSGYTGSSQYAPLAWSGDPAASFEDSDGLPSMVRAAINMGISGVPNWGGDIGGFHCLADGAAAADGELLARWIQQGALTPSMHDQNACIAAFDGATKASIWTAPEAKQAWREYARLHTRLFPYLWALGHAAHQTGAPIVRHLFFEHPEQSDLRAADDSYYFGPGLLVAPVLRRGQVAREVRLPPGRFLDWRDQILYAGNQTITVDAPLDKLPLFLRDGHLIPMLDASIDTLAPESDPNIVGREDVADVYDVVGLLSRAHGVASFTLAEGGVLRAEYSSAFADPPLPLASRESELASCGGCWSRDQLSESLARVRISHTGSPLSAGGLKLNGQSVGRKIRWDLYLVE
jgi:sulfoquinovosidase